MAVLMEGNKEVAKELMTVLLDRELSAEQDVDVALTLTRAVLEGVTPDDVSVSVLTCDINTGRVMTMSGDLRDKEKLSLLVTELQNRLNSL